MPKKFMGNEASMSNVGRALVMIEMEKGHNPLEGTGLVYKGEDLVADITPADAMPQEAGEMGMPPQPHTVPKLDGNPYDGMGSF